MTWTEIDHALHAVGSLVGLAIGALILVGIGVAFVVDEARARLRARRAHRQADRWLDPRSRPLAHRKGRGA